MRIAEAFDFYIKVKVIGIGASLHTQSSYTYAKKAAISFFGNIPLRKLSCEDISAFYSTLRQDHAPNTARFYVQELASVIRFCRSEGVKTINPEKIFIPKKEKKEQLFLDQDDVELLAREAGRHCRGYSRLNQLRNELMVRLLFCSGIRISELCALNRNSIKNRQFFVVGKSRDARPCYITAEVEMLMNRYLDAREDHSEALFVASQTGNRLTPANARTVFKRISKATGIVGVHPHTLRHSFGTTMLEGGVDIRYVSKMLGHQSLNTTQTYAHVRDARLREAYEKVMN